MSFFERMRALMLPARPSQRGHSRRFRHMRRSQLERLEDRLLLTATISGTIDYVYPGINRPLPEALVEVSFIDPLTLAPVKLGSRTDAQGHYSIGVDNYWLNVGVTSVIVSVALEGPHSANAPPTFEIFADGYFVNPKVIVPVANVTISPNSNYTANYTAPDVTQAQRAFAIFDYLVRAQHYAESVGVELPNNSSINTLHVLIDNLTPMGTDPGAKYYEGVLYLSGETPENTNAEIVENSFTPMHEFGHFVAKNNTFDNAPAGSHSYYVSQRGVRYLLGLGPLRPEPSIDDLRLSWSEGFADFFGQRVRILSGLVAPQNATEPFDFEVTSVNSFTNAGLGKVGLGEDSEVSVARILWDLVDSGSTDDDNVSFTDQELFDLMTLSLPPITTLWDLWSQLYTPSTFGDRLKYAQIFSQNGVGARAVAAPPSADWSNIDFTFDVPYARRVAASGNLTDPAPAYEPTMNQFTVRVFYDGNELWNSGAVGWNSLDWDNVNVPDPVNQGNGDLEAMRHAVLSANAGAVLGLLPSSYDPEKLVWLVESTTDEHASVQSPGYWSNARLLGGDFVGFDVQLDNIVRTSATQAEVTYTIVGRAAGAFDIAVSLGGYSRAIASKVP